MLQDSFTGPFWITRSKNVSVSDEFMAARVCQLYVFATKSLDFVSDELCDPCVGTITVIPDADPIFFRSIVIAHGFGPLAKRHRILPEKRDVAGGADGASRHPYYHPVCVGIGCGVVGKTLLLARVRHAPDSLF